MNSAKFWIPLLVIVMLLPAVPLNVSQASFILSPRVGIPSSPEVGTYSFGWGGGTIPTSGENATVFQKFWTNEGMRNSLSASNAFWMENATGSQTSCTVPWKASLVTLLSDADSYGVSIAIQVPNALTDYGDGSTSSTNYAYLATNGYTNGLTTYDKNGNVAKGFLRPDTPLLATQIYNDLISINRCFGQSNSWIGISQGSNAADLGGYDWYAPPGGTKGAGMHGMGTSTIHNWLGDPSFYSVAGNDSLTYNLIARIPIVSPLSVFKNIDAFHKQQFNNFLAWNDYNQFQLALNMFQQHTGKRLVYVDYDHQGVDRIYDFPPSQVGSLFKNITNVVLSGASPCRPSVASCIPQIMSSTNPSIGQGSTYMFNPGQCSVSHSDPTTQTLFNSMYLYPFLGAMNTQLQVDSLSTSCSGLENVKSNEFSVLTSFGGLLNRMTNYGSFYGSDNPGAPRILLVYQPSGADSNLGGEVSQILASADLNITVSSDMNLTGISLGQFNTVLYRPYTGLGGGINGGVLSPYAVGALQAFVKGGGGLVAIPSTINAYWSTTYWNKYLSAIFGASATSVAGFVSGGTISVTQPSNEILKPYSSSILSGGYAPGSGGGFSTGSIVYKVTASSVLQLVTSANLGPEVWTNTYGTGRVVMLPGGYPMSQSYGYASFDAYWTLVSNAIMYASKQDSLIPVLSYSTFLGGAQHEPWDQSTTFSLLGSPAKGLLAWFFTNKTSGDAISISLNGAAYHLGSSKWVAISVRDWSIIGQGSSSAIGLNIKLPSRGWYPVYILNVGPSGSPIYSNTIVKSTTTLGGTNTYLISAPPCFSSWLIVSSPSQPSSVSTSNSGQLQQLSSLISLNKTRIGEYWTGSSWVNGTQGGWYYDVQSQLLYVHFVGSTSLSLDVTATLLSATPLGNIGISPSITTVNSAYPINRVFLDISTITKFQESMYPFFA